VSPSAPSRKDLRKGQFHQSPTGPRRPRPGAAAAAAYNVRSILGSLRTLPRAQTDAETASFEEVEPRTAVENAVLKALR
jgi:hypothetical protein